MDEANRPEPRELANELADARLYRELFEDSLGLMCVHDLEGVLLIVNPAAAHSLGFQPEDGIGVNMRRFLAPQVAPLFDGYLERIRSNGSDSGLMRLVAKDGSERIWLYRNILYQEPGTPPRVLGHAQDITDRVRAEEALKESERRFRAMADTAPVMIWMADTEGKCVFVNRPWLEFSGRSMEEELGDGWADDIHPDDRAEAVAAYRAAAGKREDFRAEYRVRRADGQYRWILDIGTPRCDLDGRFAGYIGSCLDVTELRQHREALRAARDELALRVAERTAELSQTNEALRQSEHHYHLLAELSPVGIFRTDNQGRCLYVNERICAILGSTSEEIRRNGWDRTVHPEDRGRVMQEWRKVLDGSGPGSLEHRFLRSDGSEVWALIHFAAERGTGGQLTGCIGTVADISDRKRAEEERRRLEAQVQHAQRLQSLGILAGGLAHDFNNLLTVILGNARMALMDLPPGSPSIQNLAEIETATSRAAELTSQMLAYSGKGQFVSSAVNLSQLTGETASLLQAIISKTTVIQCNLPSALPAIDADPAQIRQVVMNLITNAAEAIGEQGGVIKAGTGIMDADRTYLSETYFDDHLPDGRYVYLEISDTGCGMTPETQARIFDPFFTTKFTGRGLGLAAVLGIVRAHRGALKVSSRLGVGSTFLLLFPCSENRAPLPPEAPAVSREARGSGMVLVIDDEPGVRNLARVILEKSGFTVITAGDGWEGIRIFRRYAGEVVAIVLDMTMPVMNGGEAIAELRHVRQGVPIILCSGYSEQEVSSRFENGTIAGVLRKPYEPGQLLSAVHKALGQHVSG
jgi:two-component system cell cycle sensor histidine kinase/response regulator CckA